MDSTDGFKYFDIDNLSWEEVLQALKGIDELQLQKPNISLVLRYQSVPSKLLKRLVQYDKELFYQAVKNSYTIKNFQDNRYFLINNKHNQWRTN